MSDRLAIPEGDRLNLSDAWIRSTAEAFPVAAIDASAPRRVYLDRDCEIFCLVSAEDYEWVTQWRWKWNWDRTKTKRYAIRTPRISNGDGTSRSVTVYMHKEICARKGPPPSELHTIGDHQDGESLNNQRDNLEWATRSQNRKNRKR
ncbi:HNH endonuclease [Bradyrhizobium sp. WSM 1738]|uniref:HNH endonuclease n=1 Tax=Bradyrhizobium hereditatis TaxID=2821405 RepID=UPI001CE27F83|nr:HNH endonuclease [Bradyrhizobium hereditatis]MCA6114278.1 HNH endonuclease [Bradyrhizobium hereditatis]